MSDELILAISGNDIFSGGGLHADLATFTTNKQHGFVALTCLTAMTENGFEVIPKLSSGLTGARMTKMWFVISMI